MTLFNKIKSRWCVLVSLLLAIFIVGCEKQPLEVNGSGGNLTIGISTGSVVGRSKEDKLIVSDIRIIVFKGATVIFNKSTKGGLVESAGTTDGVSRFTLPLAQGSYKVAVVANEPQAITTQLDAIQTFSELSAIEVAGLFTEENVPLYRESDVTIRHLTSDPTKGEVQIDGSSIWGSELEMSLERIHTRVSLYVRKNTGNNKTVVINRAELAQVPQSVYLSPRSQDHTEYRTLTPYDNTTGITFDQNSVEDIDNYASYTEVFSDGNIFAENRMNDPSDATKATTLRLQGTYGGKAVNYQYDINFNGNHTLLRNVHYKIYTTIKTDGDAEFQEIVISPELWSGEKIDIELLTPYLNVQELNLNLTLYDEVDNHYHLHYWTNQTSTLVEPTMKRFDDILGDQVMDVSTVFNNLSGAGASDNHFNTQVPGSADYTGYLNIDINKDYNFPHNTNQFRIVLNANGLRREITITIAKTAALNPTHIGYTPWIGTFHRWNQVGERVISAPHSGNWSVRVMDDVSNADNFVVITKSRSTDTALGTDNPDDAENHKLSEDLSGTGEALHDAKSTTPIVGNGSIYFRIGLKSKLASATAAPRYARVELTISEGVEKVLYLYVRQGEADDYIYDANVNLDLVTNEESPSKVSTEARSEARKISPYNLGVSRPTAGGTSFNSHYQFAENEKAVFVNYPTMAGWYFTWYFCGSTPYYDGPAAAASLVQTENPSYRKAYHPYNPIYHDGHEITGFPNMVSGVESRKQFSYYLIDRNSDPCPVGYEMMTSKEVLHSLYQSYMAFIPVHNTSFQFKAQNRAAINYLWGYYADGYYDRRVTRSLRHGGGDNYYRPFQLTGYNSDVAYMGALFYNHNTDKNNSVFLPGAGVRTSTTPNESINSAGSLQNIGGRAVYYLEDSYYDTRSPYEHTGIGTIEVSARPRSNSAYTAPTVSTYEFNFSFRGQGANATPMRCVKKSYAGIPVNAVVVFDWNGASSVPLDATVVGTINNQYTTASGTTINFGASGNFMPAAGVTFSKAGRSVSFQSWNTRANGSGTTYTAAMSMTLPVGVRILYAQWL